MGGHFSFSNPHGGAASGHLLRRMEKFEASPRKAEDWIEMSLNQNWQWAHIIVGRRSIIGRHCSRHAHRLVRSEELVSTSEANPFICNTSVVPWGYCKASNNSMPMQPGSPKNLLFLAYFYTMEGIFEITWEWMGILSTSSIDRARFHSHESVRQHHEGLTVNIIFRCL